MKEGFLVLRKLTGILFIFYLSISYLAGQEYPAKRIIPHKLVEKETKTIQHNHTNKSLEKLPDAGMQCLYTLSFFPELKDVRIEFVTKNIKTTMAARPKWNFIFKRKQKRIFQVVFNSDTAANAISFSELPLNAQIGILGHEYCHLIDYLNRGNLNLVAFGIRYCINEEFKATIEHTVDKLAIEKGLGWQLHDFSVFVLDDEDTPEEYKKYKRKYYLSPEDIVRNIREEYSDAM